MGRKKLTDKRSSKKKDLKSKKSLIPAKEYKRLLGMKDVMSGDYRFLNPIIKKIEETANCYSFDRVETPILESSDFYKKIFDKNKKNILFNLDQNAAEKITLRPDLVHGMIRAFIEHGNLNELNSPKKLFSIGPVFRQEKVRGGVYRQFNQFNFSIINDPKPITDAFLIYLVFNIFKELQIDVQVQINSLGDEDCQDDFLNKFSKFLKERGRRGKFCKECQKNIGKASAALLDCNEEPCLKLRNEMPQIVEFLSEESNSRLYKVMEFLDEMNVNYNFNPYLTRDLGYYNDIIFEVWPVDKSGELNSKLALGRGGRYDEVFSKISKKEISMLGFSGGIERILIKAKENNLFIKDDKESVFLAQIDAQAKAKTMVLFKELQKKGFKVRQAFHLDGLKDQLEESKKFRPRVVLILGKKELSDDTILFRDTDSGTQEIIAQKDILSRLEKLLK